MVCRYHIRQRFPEFDLRRRTIESSHRQDLVLVGIKESYWWLCVCVCMYIHIHTYLCVYDMHSCLYTTLATCSICFPNYIWRHVIQNLPNSHATYYVYIHISCSLVICIENHHEPQQTWLPFSPSTKVAQRGIVASGIYPLVFSTCCTEVYVHRS